MLDSLGQVSRVDTANIVKRGVRPLVTICEGHQLCFQQPHKSCVSNDANSLQRYALKWKIIQPKIAEKDMSKNKQEKARRQNGAFAVHTVRQSRAGGLETTGFFGSSKAR